MAIILTEEDRTLIKKIGLRIANKKIKVNIRDLDESYTNEAVIVVPPRVDAFTTMAITVHQGAHHRFRSVINDKLYIQISKEFPEIAHVILDAFEDFRCNMLNEHIYPGFVKKFREYIADTNTFHNGKNYLQNTVMQVHHRLEFEAVFDGSNTYPIWEVLDEQKLFLQQYLSTSAMMIAAKTIVDQIISHYICDTNRNREAVQYTQKTRTPNFNSHSLDDSDTNNLHHEFFNSPYGKRENLRDFEKQLRDERDYVLRLLEEMKKLPQSENPGYVKSKLKLDCISPEQYGCGDFYEDIVTRNANIVMKLRKEFQQIMRSPNPRRGGRRGKIVARDLPRFVTSKGNFDRVFQIDQNSYGANAMILVDESGSMTRKKLPIAREAIITIMEALEGTKINTCVIGFAAKNGSPVVSEKVYKEFNSPINRKKLASINTTEAYEYNRDGDSFELAAKHFAETNHQNSIMIVISDGCPNHGSNYTGKEGIRLTNLSIRLLRNRGIELYALGIKIYTPIRYSEMYDHKGISFIDTYEIETALTDLIRQIAADIIRVAN